MKTRQIKVPLPRHGRAALHLPAPLTRELLTVLEQALAQTLARLRDNLSKDARDPGLIEYASWMPPGRR